MVAKKVLIILSDAHSFQLRKTTGQGAKAQETEQPTGYFLTELAKPLEKILSAGYEVTFSSPKGKEPQADPASESLLVFAGNFYQRRRENALIDRMKKENGFDRPRPFTSISDSELDSFTGVFIPGGHAPLTDLGADRELGRILRHFHANSKPTAVICHGSYALLSTREVGDHTFAYKGYSITCWSNFEEKTMETLFRGKIDPKVESALREAGANMVEGWKETAGAVTVDRELVSGDNPMAAGALGDRFVNMLHNTIA